MIVFPRPPGWKRRAGDDLAIRPAVFERLAHLGDIACAYVVERRRLHRSITKPFGESPVTLL